MTAVIFMVTVGLVCVVIVVAMAGILSLFIAAASEDEEPTMLEEPFTLTCPRGHTTEPQLKFNGGDPVWICSATLSPEERHAITRHPLEVVDDLEECRIIIRRATYDPDHNRWE